jgi:hypothetical protein
MANALIHGSLGHLYASGYDGLPLWPILLSPLMLVADLLGIRSGPQALPPLAYLVVPYACLLGLVVAHAGRRLAWDLGVRSRLWVFQACLVLCVLFPTISWGHPEDALAVAFLLYSWRLYRNERWYASALFLGLAICSKQWAVLLTPMLIAGSGPRKSGFAAICLAPALLLGGAFVLIDPNHAILAFSPEPSPPELWTIRGPTLLLGARGSRLVRPLELAAMPVLAMYLRRYGGSTLVICALAMLLLRGLLEPVIYSYYLAPATAVLTIACIARSQRPRLAMLALPLAAAVWAEQVYTSTVTWWVIAGAILASALLVTRGNWSYLALSSRPETMHPGSDRGIDISQGGAMPSRSHSVEPQQPPSLLVP